MITNIDIFNDIDLGSVSEYNDTSRNFSATEDQTTTLNQIVGEKDINLK